MKGRVVLCEQSMWVGEGFVYDEEEECSRYSNLLQSMLKW